jgi:hypothetical protein
VNIEEIEQLLAGAYEEKKRTIMKDRAGGCAVGTSV